MHCAIVVLRSLLTVGRRHYLLLLLVAAKYTKSHGQRLKKEYNRQVLRETTVGGLEELQDVLARSVQKVGSRTGIAHRTSGFGTTATNHWGIVLMDGNIFTTPDTIFIHKPVVTATQIDLRPIKLGCSLYLGRGVR